MITNIRICSQTCVCVNTDCAQQERFRTITSSYYRGAQIAIIVFDLTNMESFRECKDWLRDVERYASENIILLAAGSKCDLVDARVIDNQLMQDFFSNMTPPIPCYEVSAKTGTGVEELFFDAASMWLTKFESELSDREKNKNGNGEDAKSSSKNENADDKHCIIC